MRYDGSCLVQFSGLHWVVCTHARPERRAPKCGNTQHMDQHKEAPPGFSETVRSEPSEPKSSRAKFSGPIKPSCSSRCLRPCRPQAVKLQHSVIRLVLGKYAEGPRTQYLATWVWANSKYNTGYGQVYDNWALGPLEELGLASRIRIPKSLQRSPTGPHVGSLF